MDVQNVLIVRKKWAHLTLQMAGALGPSVWRDRLISTIVTGAKVKAKAKVITWQEPPILSQMNAI